jgi:hypothetical protein
LEQRDRWELRENKAPAQNEQPILWTKPTASGDYANDQVAAAAAAGEGR